MSRVVVSNAGPSILFEPVEDRRVAVTVLNLGVAACEIVESPSDVWGEGFPLLPATEYKTECAGNTELWAITESGTPVVLAVMRVSVEPPAVVWSWKGPVEDTVIASLPFYEAQEQLKGPVKASSAVLGTCEWHGAGPTGDPNRTSFALVDEEGPLGALVGERVQVSFQGKVVFAYVLRAASLDAEMSLTRRLFMALAPLATTEVDVEIQVVV